MKRLIQGCCLAIVLCAPLGAARAHAMHTMGAVESRLLHVLAKRFPKIKIDTVEPSPVPGLYTVIAGSQVVYVDRSGNHLIVGSMMDTRTKENLSRAALDAHESIDFDSLPFGEAIKIVKGDGARKIALFADPDCPYCRRLERQDFASMTNLTVYLFLFPLPSVHPHALVDAKAIWCSHDRGSAWTHWMLSSTWMRKRTPTLTGGSCAHDPIGKIRALARKLRIDATPTLFLANGRRIGGFVPKAQLQHLLALASRPAAGAGPTSSTSTPN